MNVVLKTSPPAAAAAAAAAAAEDNDKCLDIQTEDMI